MSLATAAGFASAVYPLDEASGDAIDAIGSLDLTDNNTVGASAGILGACRDLESGTDEYFTHASAAAINGPGDSDFTICFYLNPESITSGFGIISKWQTGGQLSYLIRWSGSQIQAFLSADGSASTNLTAATFGNLSTATTYSVAVVNDSVNDLLKIYVNGTKDQTAHAGGVFAGSDAFYVGRAGSGENYDGLLSQVVILQGYAFTDADATEHAAVLTFANWTAGGGRTTKNTRSAPLGVAIGMGWRM